MKKFPILLSVLFAVISANAQLVAKARCNEFEVDLLKGTINGIKCSDGIEYIKKTFPCFTSSEPEGQNTTCGGGVFFKDKDLYFYTLRNYVEIGPKFKGKLSLPLMGAYRNKLFSYLGNPVVKDDTWEAYTLSYGTLVLHFDKASKVNKIQFSSYGVSTLQLCN